MEISGLGAAPGLQALRERLFQRADRNQDGGIDLAEFKNAGKKLPTSAESAQRTTAVEQVFTKLDADQDGKITQSELPQPTSFLSASNRFELQESGFGQSFGQQGQQNLRERFFQRADANQDGGIDLSELQAIGRNREAGAAEPGRTAAIDELFARLDADQDGRITQGELTPPSPFGAAEGRPFDLAETLRQSERREGFQERVSQIYKQLDSLLLRQTGEGQQEQASRLALTI